MINNSSKKGEAVAVYGFVGLYNKCHEGFLCWHAGQHDNNFDVKFIQVTELLENIIREIACTSSYAMNRCCLAKII